MTDHQIPRRDFLRLLSLAFPAAAIDWNTFPSGAPPNNTDDEFDVVVIGSGLGGLSCAAAFARKGFRPLVLEQHDKPGGFATAFSRPGGFRFDVSLHSTSVGQRNGINDLIQGFPEITGVEFLPHPTLFRAIYPEHDLRVAQKDPAAFIKELCRLFPHEAQGITGLFEDMGGLAQDIGKLSAARGNVDMSRFPIDFPQLYRFNNKTWGEMMETRIKDQKLKALVSAQWGYYGLPPSKLSCFYYALPFTGYLAHGGFYPKGRSQDISTALASYVSQHGGTVLLNTKADRILTKANAAYGVATADGRTFRAKAVVSNVSPFETFGRLLDDRTSTKAYEAAWEKYSVSLSCFQVFLGLKEDLVGKLGIRDSEIFIESSYDPEKAYADALAGNVETGGIGVSLYDNVVPGYSPAGKNTVNILTLQGYGPWEKFEKDYRAGNKAEYKEQKEHMAQILIGRAEQSILPGLSRAIEVAEIGTPLTNVRYTGHHRGAIYGWDQTVNNSGSTRVGHSTPVKGLFLAGAWSRPGHGYGAVIPSGIECFAEITRNW
jgi:all-trans-retinol 13,14-reductase